MKNFSKKLISVSFVFGLSFSMGWIYDYLPGDDNAAETRATHPTKKRV